MANYDLTYEGSRVQNILDTGDELRDAGYIFRGEATPSTVPGTPTERVAYIGGPGTYTNFGSTITVGAGCICVFKYTGSAWSNQVINTGLSDAISSEASARQLGDSTLQGGINTVSAAITAINNAIGNGCVYAGIATPSSTPASGKVFYLAFTAGTYTNFNSLEVPQGINILKNDGSTWLLDSFLIIDDAPTQGSDNLVKSGGVLNSIIQNGPAFDLSAYNAQGGTLATYADLSAALTALNVLPADFKKGGMSFKFVLTYDNKYVQYRLMSDTFNTTPANWQGVDDEPTAGSGNLVKSGGVEKKTRGKDVVIRHLYGINLFDKRKTTKGRFIRPTDGTIQSYSNIYISDLIQVNICDKVTISANSVFSDAIGWRFIGSDGTTVISYGGYNSSSSVTVEVPTNAVYLQISAFNTQLDSTQVEFGSSATTYKEYHDNTTDVPNGIATVSSIAKENKSKINGYNLLDTSNYLLQNQFIQPINGTINNANGFYTSQLIDVEDNTNITVSCVIEMSNITGWRFIGTDGTTVVSYGSLGGYNFTKSVPAGAKYFQISASASTLEQMMVEYGVIVHSYEPYYNIQDSLPNYIDNKIKDVDKKIDNLSGNVKNLLDLNDLYEKGARYYIKPADGTIDSTGYDLCVSGLIDVSGLNKIAISLSSGELTTVCGYRFLGSDGSTIISYDANSASGMVLNVPTNAKYFQISSSQVHFVNMQVEAGNTVTAFEKRDEYLSQSNFEANKYPKYYSLTGRKTIAANTTETIFANSITNFNWNCNISFLFESFTSVLIQRGINVAYGKSTLLIDGTNVTAEFVDDHVVETVAHGLTISTSLSVNMHFEKSHLVLRICAGNESFEHIFNVFDGTDGLVVKNNGSSAITIANATLNFSKDYNKKIVLVGDSYAWPMYGFSTGDFYGYTYEMEKIGCEFMNLSFPGANSSQMLSQIEGMLDVGYHPDIVIWAMGMNDSSTSVYTTQIKHIIYRCLLLGITFIPCTIPSVPARNKDEITAYIKENFERYVDFDKALTNSTPWVADGSNWIDGFLRDSDHLHPTVNGQFAMFSQILYDIPELMY